MTSDIMKLSFALGLGLIKNRESAITIREIANREGAFLKGEFVLSSGQKSDHYFEGKRLTSSPDGAYWVGKAIFTLWLLLTS